MHEAALKIRWLMSRFACTTDLEDLDDDNDALLDTEDIVHRRRMKPKKTMIMTPWEMFDDDDDNDGVEDGDDDGAQGIIDWTANETVTTMVMAVRTIQMKILMMTMMLSLTTKTTVLYGEHYEQCGF